MKYSLLSLVMLCFIFLVSCSEEENPVQPPPSNPEMLVLNEKTADGIKMQLLAADSLEPGYNKIYIKLTNVSTGDIIRKANIRVTLTAAEGMDSQSSPVEQPGTTASDDMFSFEAVFFEFGDWSFEIDVDSESGAPLASYLLVPVSVKYVPYETGRISNIGATDGKTYLIAMKGLREPSVGMNDIGFAVYSTEDLASFSRVEDLTFVMTPTLTSTGESSTGNVNPVHTTGAHYAGKVNLTKKGEWKISLDMQRGTENLDSTYFIVTF